MTERSRYEQKCIDCGNSDFVEDRAAGDLTCQVLLSSKVAISTPCACGLETGVRRRVG